jgi:hypothetical protein
MRTALDTTKYARFTRFLSRLIGTPLLVDVPFITHCECGGPTGQSERGEEPLARDLGWGDADKVTARGSHVQTVPTRSRSETASGCGEVTSGLPTSHNSASGSRSRRWSVGPRCCSRRSR